MCNAQKFCAISLSIKVPLASRIQRQTFEQPRSERRRQRIYIEYRKHVVITTNFWDPAGSCSDNKPRKKAKERIHPSWRQTNNRLFQRFSGGGLPLKTPGLRPATVNPKDLKIIVRARVQGWISIYVGSDGPYSLPPLRSGDRRAVGRNRGCKYEYPEWCELSICAYSIFCPRKAYGKTDFMCQETTIHISILHMDCGGSPQLLFCSVHSLKS